MEQLLVAKNQLFAAKLRQRKKLRQKLRARVLSIGGGGNEVCVCVISDTDTHTHTHTNTGRYGQSAEWGASAYHTWTTGDVSAKEP